MKNIILTVFIYIIIFSSCNIYNGVELVEEGKNVINKYQDDLELLIELANKLAIEQCVNYQISTSPTTNSFSFEEYEYNTKLNYIEIKRGLEISDYEQNLIWDNLPYEYFSDFYFVKDVNVTFAFEFLRDRKLDDAKLIYCLDKNKFKKLHPDYTFYENGQEDELNDTCNWVYFYDNNWAITTCGSYIYMTNENCLKLCE